VSWQGAGRGWQLPHPTHKFGVVKKLSEHFLLVGKFLSKNAKYWAENPHFGEIWDNDEILF